MHFQNNHDLEPYLELVESGRIPVHRGMRPTAEESLIREFVLQMKLGWIDVSYFQEKFGVDVTERFKEPLAAHVSAGFMTVAPDRIELSRTGLLRVDELLHSFFLDRHRQARYA